MMAFLSQIKDSNMMDVGTIADMADSGRISGIVQENKGSIMEGASSIGKILLNLVSGKSEFVETMGDKKFKKTVGNLRAMFVKMTDLYVDIMKMDVNAGSVAE